MVNVPVSFVIGAGTARGAGGVWASVTDAPTVVSATAAEPPAPAAFRKCLRENFTSSPRSSEEILQGKLENPGIERLADHPECIGITENHRRIDRSKTVRDVIRLDSKFEPLAVAERKYSREGHVERPLPRTSNRVATDVSNRAESRQRERGRIEEPGPGVSGSIAVRVREYLIRALQYLLLRAHLQAVQCPICAGQDRERHA